MLNEKNDEKANDSFCSELLYIKKSKMASFLCLIVLIFIYIAGCWICINMDNNQYATSTSFCFIKLPSPFAILNLFMYLGSGICAYLFSFFTPSENRYIRWLLWGIIQGIGTWILAFSITFARYRGDGSEGFFQLWSPPIVSAVFLSAVFLYSESTNPIRYQDAYKLRKICLLLLVIGLISTIVSTF